MRFFSLITCSSLQQATILNDCLEIGVHYTHDLIDNKGDGLKRSLTFALLRAYVQKQKTNDTSGQGPAARPLLFLFEETELYLHPKSQRMLFDTLSDISELYQVVVTTHSPIFFAPGITASFVRVAKKDASPKPLSILNPVNFKLDQASAEVFRLAKFDNAEAAFFSGRVVLFEGESDDAFCRHLSKFFDPLWNFDQKNVAMVRVLGKGNFSKFRKFFNLFGIEVKLVADLDALFEGYNHLGAASTTDLIRDAALKKIDERIAALGEIAEPASRQIIDRVNQYTWREKYVSAKAALRTLQKTQIINEQILCSIDELFTWEREIVRVSVCRKDAIAAAALVPVLDDLRAQGICILSKGAIEDYYPNGVSSSGPKPERAIVAASLICNADQAKALSDPLATGRAPKLLEVFQELFRDL